MEEFSLAGMRMADKIKEISYNVYEEYELIYSNVVNKNNNVYRRQNRRMPL